MRCEVTRCGVMQTADYNKENEPYGTISYFYLTSTEPLQIRRKASQKSVQHALQAYGIDEPDLDKLCPFIGPPLSDSFKRILRIQRSAGARSDRPFPRIYFTKQGMFENKSLSGNPGDADTRLKDAGLTLAVA